MSFIHQKESLKRSRKFSFLLDHVVVLGLINHLFLVLTGLNKKTDNCLTNISMMKINSCAFLLINRFINARRRIVQPMIDQSNRAGIN